MKNLSSKSYRLVNFWLKMCYGNVVDKIMVEFFLNMVIIKTSHECDLVARVLRSRFDWFTVLIKS